MEKLCLTRVSYRYSARLKWDKGRRRKISACRCVSAVSPWLDGPSSELFRQLVHSLYIHSSRTHKAQARGYAGRRILQGLHA